MSSREAILGRVRTALADVPAPRLGAAAIEAARALARTIADNGPLAVAASKGIVRDSWLWDVADINTHQRPYIAHVFTSEDAREGATAFAQKREPQWRGC